MNKNRETTTKKIDSDFEHLKVWQDNPDLDYYMSGDHWNFHVNQLLYRKLSTFYDGVSVGQYLNPPPNGIERFAQSIPNYSPLYGELFNEAYRLCSQVMTTPIPQTKIDLIAEQAAQIGLIRLFGLEIATKGMPGHNQPAPMVQDIIESYHILGMVNTILTFANDQQDAIDRFLIALSDHNDYNRYYAFEYHNFQRYNLMYQDLIVYTLNHETGLRPGYDYKKRKEYLRNKMSWFSVFENKYVKERHETESEKSTNIKEQNNYNSQVFNNCQVTINNLNATAEATGEKLRAGTQKKKCDRKQPPKGDTEKQHGVEYPVFKKGPGVTDYHIKALYLYLTARNWISTQTKEVDFLRLFNGQDNDCEIIWTGQDKLGNNEPTPLGVSALYVLFKSMADEGYIMTGTKSNRVGPILESHFVDSNGHFLTSVSNVKTTSQTASTYIKKILATMQMRANQKFIQEKLNSDLSTLIEQEGEEKYNKYEH